MKTLIIWGALGLALSMAASAQAAPVTFVATYSGFTAAENHWPGYIVIGKDETKTLADWVVKINVDSEAINTHIPKDDSAVAGTFKIDSATITIPQLDIYDMGFEVDTVTFSWWSMTYTAPEKWVWGEVHYVTGARIFKGATTVDEIADRVPSYSTNSNDWGAGNGFILQRDGFKLADGRRLIGWYVGGTSTLSVVRAVPEPSIYAMIGLGFGLVGLFVRRKKQSEA